MAYAVITQLFWDAEMPRPSGRKKGAGDLRMLLHDAETWTIS